VYSPPQDESRSSLPSLLFVLIIFFPKMSSPPPHQPYQQPVNFGENPSTSSRYSHDFTGGVHNAPDTSTVYSYPVGRPQSGVTAYERDPYADPYEGGETHAQAVASEYTRSLSSPRDASSPFDSQGIRRADTKKSAALSYVDENFNYYRSTPDAQDAALVHNVADVAGHEHNQSNSNFDLGTYYFLYSRLSGR
jgi:hypothetical protein